MTMDFSDKAIEDLCDHFTVIRPIEGTGVCLTSLDDKERALVVSALKHARARKYKAPPPEYTKAFSYSAGLAGIVETISKGCGVPPENMQHCVEGFWKEVRENNIKCFD